MTLKIQTLAASTPRHTDIVPTMTDEAALAEAVTILPNAHVLAQTLPAQIQTGVRAALKEISEMRTPSGEKFTANDKVGVIHKANAEELGFVTYTLEIAGYAVTAQGNSANNEAAVVFLSADGRRLAAGHWGVDHDEPDSGFGWQLTA